MDQTSLPLPHKPSRAGRPEAAGFGVSPILRRRHQPPWQSVSEIAQQSKQRGHPTKRRAVGIPLGDVAQRQGVNNHSLCPTKKKRDSFKSLFFRVGAEGVEPPTLCL